ncbi:MAG: hypothetical protein NZ602_04565, partial [Thermoguttaceae bacterium]|nr:hypothetical protein [Thermoguttaceae bacterium]
ASAQAVQSIFASPGENSFVSLPPGEFFCQNPSTPHSGIFEKVQIPGIRYIVYVHHYLTPDLIEGKENLQSLYIEGIQMISGSDGLPKRLC